jgi:outer membrane protein assembly factor BamD
MPRPPRPSRLALALAVAFAAALALALACATKHTTVSGKLKLGATAEENYQNGMDELKAKHSAEAMRFFEYVKSKYPFSPVSAKAELRIADIRMADGRDLEAAEGYERFVKDHPSSDEIDYAQYRAGLAHLKASPPDFALFPPVQEKDQRETERAVTALRALLEKYPDSQYVPEARKSLQKAEDLLARRELYVGDYYYRRGYWAGAAGRYQGLVDGYPDAPLARPALLKLARTYLNMNEKHQARQALQRLITQHPDSRERPEAEKLLASLR